MCDDASGGGAAGAVGGIVARLLSIALGGIGAGIGGEGEGFCGVLFISIPYFCLYGYVIVCVYGCRCGVRCAGLCGHVRAARGTFARDWRGICGVEFVIQRLIIHF